MKPLPILVAALAILAVPALAQQPPTAPPAGGARPAPAPDPKLQAAQAAFEALPEAERRAIQQDLGFATKFNGAALGTFGPLTYNGILAFERENKLAVDGILTPEERKTLASVAQNARRALRFAVIDDERSRAKIGVPQNVFVKREPNSLGGLRWQTADGKATLDTIAPPKDETLQSLFDKATAAQPNRKVTYKLLRPDFFVVTAETAGGKSYRRISLGPDGALRGFALGYDKALAEEMDRLAISIANSYDAFPGTATAAATPAATQGSPQGALSAAALAAAGAAAARPGAGGAAPAAPQPAAPRERLATGLVLEGGFILTAEAATRECRTLAVGPRKTPARPVVADAAAGLSLLRADGLRASGLALGEAAKPDQTFTVLAEAWSGTQPAAVYAEALAVGNGRIAAPLQPGGAGAALFDAEGRLAGLVADDPGARRQIAGVAPAARYRFAGPEAIAAFLQRNGAVLGKAAPQPASGGVAAARREAVTPLVCTL
jgi:peptidoglycan hydrolase-like protein with peptidoglycan-binding domain